MLDSLFLQDFESNLSCNVSSNIVRDQVDEGSVVNHLPSNIGKCFRVYKLSKENAQSDCKDTPILWGANGMAVHCRHEAAEHNFRHQWRQNTALNKYLCQ